MGKRFSLSGGLGKFLLDPEMKIFVAPQILCYKIENKILRGKDWEKMKTRGPLVLAVVGLTGLILLGVQWTEPAWAQGGGTGIFQSYAKPQPLPDFSLEDLPGRLTPINEFKRRVILLHFWATW